MKNLEELFKQICLEEANDLNKFWITSTAKLAELEMEWKDEKLKERTRELRRIKLCEDIDEILNHDGYNGTASEVIEYFSRTALNYTVRNAYFDIHPRLQKLYNLLPKNSNKLGDIQTKYNKLKIKMFIFKHVNADILYNSILAAFQELIPETDYRFNIDSCVFPLPIRSTAFPWSKEAKDEFIDYELVTWYKNNIDEYLCCSINELKLHKRSKLFN